jgi:hypothetical protein
MTVKGTDQVIKNLSVIEKNIVREIINGAQAVQAKTVIDARSNVPTGVTGALSLSIQAGDITITDDNVEALVLANADYSSFVEFGTRPHFPPIDALKDWCEKVLGDAGLAWVVARAISRRGTLAHPFMGPALIQNMPVFHDAIMAGIDRGLAAGGL